MYIMEVKGTMCGTHEKAHEKEYEKEGSIICEIIEGT